MRRTFENAVWVSVGLIVMLLLLFPVISYRNTHQLNEDARWVAHTRQVSELTGDVMLALVDAETGQRGFVITGEDAFLEPYAAALLRLDGLMAELKDKTKANSDLRARVTELEELTAVRLGQMKKSVAVRRVDEEAAKAFVRTGTPNAQTAAIRKHLAEMEQVNDGLLKDAERKNAAAYQVAVTGGMLTALTSLFTVGVFVWLLKRSLRTRRRTEQTLRESQQFTRSVLDNLFAFVGVTTVDGTLTDVNRAPLEVAGIPASEVLGKKFWDCSWWSYSPEIQAQLRDACERAAGGEVVRYDVPVRMAGDTRMWIDFQVAPLRDTEGRITHLIPSAMEIEVRRAAVEKLRASEEFSRTILQSSPDCVKVLDGEGRLQFMNTNGMCAMEIDDFEPFRDQPWWSLWGAENTEMIKSVVATALESGTAQFQALSPTAKGTMKWWDVVVGQVAGSNPKRLVSISRDITERKQAEAALKDAMQEAQRSARAKDDFLAALSHELRTPLTPVLMMATALGDDPALSPEVRGQLAMMRRNIELEARLIDDLLDLTRISRGKLVIDRQLTDVHQLLDHTAEIVRSDRLGEEVPVVLTHEAARHHALADSTRLQQVFWNLIKNAVKFTPPGGKITVTTRNDEAGRIVISVADTGLGISREALPNILKAFEQGDVSGSHRYGGLGLGLAISKAVMDAHGGTILAESPGPGLGATFTVALESAEAPAPVLLAADATPASPSRGLRLLVVEDHETTRMVLAQLLSKRGHHVTTVGSIQEALAAFAGEHFDGVISDLGLPDGSGLDLMRQIQRQRPVPVPAIALSGYGMEDDLRRTKEAGFFAHLVKPVNLDQLRQLIDQITPSSS